MAPSRSVEEARRHIEDIRRRKGLDDPDVARNHSTDLERALHVISDQLYQECTHFLLEIIQNADDNQYDEHSVPTLDFILHQDHLRIDCNELGFEAKHVEAICSIALSTKDGKSKAHGYIGEKGIGFKSIFKVAEVVSISSGSYSFKFDKSEALGMIAPIWAEFPVQKRHGYTSFFLQLSPECDKHELADQLRKFDERTLIFLRRLRRINITVEGPNAWKNTINREDQANDGFNLVTLRRNSSLQRYLVFGRSLKCLPLEEKRLSNTESETFIAFPITSLDVPIIASQSVYAFLPIRDYGFKFLLHGDFILTANRQDIEVSNAWNQALVKEINCAVIDVLKQLALGSSTTKLRYAWIDYLPKTNISGNIFTNFEKDLQKVLGDTPLLISEDDGLVTPRSVWYIPEQFRDEHGVPFSLNPTTAPKYLSRKYTDSASTSLMKLGVRQVTLTEFLADLTPMINRHENESTRRRKRYYSTLTKTLMPHLGDKFHGNQIRELHIIKLRNGKWTNATSGPIFFSSEDKNCEVPEGVNAMVVDPQFAKDTKIRLFYTALGVTTLGVDAICRQIVETHQNPEFDPSRLTLENLVSHVAFLFKAQFEWKISASSLWLRTDTGGDFRARECYQDAPIFHSARRYCGSSAGCHFIHSAYAAIGVGRERQFQSWLFRYMDIWPVPRLARYNVDGTFSMTPEFGMILEKTPSAEYLVLLRDWWEEAYSRWIPPTCDNLDEKTENCVKKLKMEIAYTNVVCSGSKRAFLCHTFFPFPERLPHLKWAPLIEIPAPEDSRWRFLEIFGVQVQKSVHFYLHCLESLASKNDLLSSDIEYVSWLYDDIQMWVGRDEEFVRKVFSSKGLVFIPSPKVHDKGYWVPLTYCTWKGPNLNHFKSIEKYYGSKEKLFCNILKIRDMDIDHVVYELEHLQRHTHIRYIEKIFEYLNLRLQKIKERPESTIELLYTQRAFPVCSANGCKRTKNHYDYLATAEWNSNWVIPDREELQKSFFGKVPFLAFDLNTILKFVSLFQTLGLSDRLLSKAAKENPSIEGYRRFEMKYTTLLRERKMNFIIRLIPEDAENRKLIAASLRNINVWTVDSLKQSRVLSFRERDVYGDPVAVSAVILPNEKSVELFVLRKDMERAQYNFHFDVADLLAKYCKVKDELKPLMYLVISERNENIIRRQFSNKGVRDLTEDEEVEREDYFKDAASTYDQAQKARIEDLAYAEGYEVSKIRIFLGRDKKPPKDDREGLSDSINELYLLTSSDESTSSDSQKEDEDPAEASFLFITKGAENLRRRLRRRRQHAIDNEDEETALAGEVFISRLFEHVLPEFYDPMQHWTSSFHREETGAADNSYKPVWNCSFTIPDSIGLFSRFLLSAGLDVCGRWLNNPPTYHIEVVGTKKGLHSAFLMRNDWWKMVWKFSSDSVNPFSWCIAIARKLSLPPSQVEDKAIESYPRDVCILVRVFNLGSGNPEVAFFLDPWKCFMADQISLEAEGRYIARVRKNAYA